MSESKAAYKPELILSYIGPSGAVDRIKVSPDWAAEKHPELFLVLLEEMKEAGRKLATAPKQGILLV